MIDAAVLARLERQYGKATVLDGDDHKIAARMLSVTGAQLVAVGDARFVVVRDDGSEQLLDLKGPIR